jgi:hypothetical protein
MTALHHRGAGHHALETGLPRAEPMTDLDPPTGEEMRQVSRYETITPVT